MKRVLQVLVVFILMVGYMNELSSPSASILPKSSVARTSQPATGEILVLSAVHAFVRNGSSNNPSKVQVFKKVGTDDRAILEFNISSITSTVAEANIIMNRSDPLEEPDKFPRTYDVFGYVGDGVLMNSDFELGSLVLPNVIYNNEPTLTLNVTAFINSLISNEDSFAGFSIRQQEAIAAPSDAEYGTETGAYPVLIIVDTTAVFRIERSTGNVFAQGAFIPDGADLAEHINVSEPVEPGDVVEFDPNKPHFYRKAQGNSRLIAGIITTTPGFILGNKPEEMKTSEFKSFNNSLKSEIMDRPMLALLGRVPVKVTTENGLIRPGDLLTVSRKPGFATRCTNPKLCEGAIIGKALEGLERGEGKILVIIMGH